MIIFNNFVDVFLSKVFRFVCFFYILFCALFVGLFDNFHFILGAVIKFFEWFHSINCPNVHSLESKMEMLKNVFRLDAKIFPFIDMTKFLPWFSTGKFFVVTVLRIFYVRKLFIIINVTRFYDYYFLPKTICCCLLKMLKKFFVYAFVFFYKNNF